MNIKNPRSKFLAWKNDGIWQPVSIYGIDWVLRQNKFKTLPRTFIGKVRLFISLCKEEGNEVRFMRYEEIEKGELVSK